MKKLKKRARALTSRTTKDQKCSYLAKKPHNTSSHVYVKADFWIIEEIEQLICIYPTVKLKEICIFVVVKWRGTSDIWQKHNDDHKFKLEPNRKKQPGATYLVWIVRKSHHWSNPLRQIGIWASIKHSKISDAWPFSHRYSSFHLLCNALDSSDFIFAFVVVPFVYPVHCRTSFSVTVMSLLGSKTTQLTQEAMAQLVLD